MRSTAKVIGVLVSALPLMACEEVSVTETSAGVATVTGNPSCIAAVNRQVGVEGAAVSQSPVIVEVNQVLVKAGDGSVWSCFTNENGRAYTLIKRS